MSAIPAQAELLSEAEAFIPVLAKVDEDPKLLLLGKVDKDAYFAELEAEAAVDADIDTAKGRDAIKSAAQSIRTRKAAIDRTRKGLTEHWRNQTAAVNAAGKVLEAEYDALIEQVRAPVTAWEKAEDERKAEADRILEWLADAKTVHYGMTSEAAENRLNTVRGINLNPDILGVRIDMATDLRDEAVAKLTEAVASLKAQEAQAAELERLRAEQAANEERRQREEQERQAAAAREAAAKAEAERLERAKAEAAEQAKREAEAAAQREQEEREREAQAKIDEANARALEAERAAEAERQRLVDLEAAQQAAADAEAQEKARREADIAHREQIIDAAADAIVKLGLTKKLATAVVNAVAAGNVPNMEVRF
jgi:colicin import membrane protein